MAWALTAGYENFVTTGVKANQKVIVAGQMFLPSLFSAFCAHLQSPQFLEALAIPSTPTHSRVTQLG
jgi:hypothetical protein